MYVSFKTKKSTPKQKNTSSTEYTDAYSPTELGAMEPVNTYELANQVGSIERSARSEINGLFGLRFNEGYAYAYSVGFESINTFPKST
jgi:hypothetical protein